MTARRPPPEARPGPTRKHGITLLKDALKRSRNPSGLDKRTKTAHVIAEWRQELIEDLGGADVVTAQQVTIVDLATRSKILVDSIDSWLMAYQHAGHSLVNKRTRALLPVVRERQALADGLARYIAMLGLERRQRPVTSLADYLQTSEPQPQANGDTRSTYPRTPKAPGTGRFVPKDRPPRTAVTGDDEDRQHPTRQDEQHQDAVNDQEDHDD